MSDLAEQTISALARSVHTIDAARRVGWAKAFESKEQLDAALRDVNMFRSDRDIYRRATSYCFGLFSTILPEAHARRRSLMLAMERYVGEQLAEVLDDDSFRAGCAEGHRIRSWDTLNAEERAAAAKANAEALAAKVARRAKNRGGGDQWRAAKRRALLQLAGRHGIRSLAELNHVLSSYATATNREPIDWRKVKRREVDDEMIEIDDEAKP